MIAESQRGPKAALAIVAPSQGNAVKVELAISLEVHANERPRAALDEVSDQRGRRP